MENRLHYLVSESGSRFVVHCLDYDLIASAETYHEAVRRLTFVVSAHVATANRQGLQMALEHKAPDGYWEKFQHLRDEGSISREAPGLGIQYEAVGAIQ